MSAPVQLPRADDPRVMRSRAAVADAARALFLRKGYAGTTMDEVAAAAGLTKRTLYSNYAGKDALFRLIVGEVLTFADAVSRSLGKELDGTFTRASLHATLDGIAQRLALSGVRSGIVGMRRLIIGEARTFPALGAEYFDRVPGQVMDSLAAGFRKLARDGLLDVPDARLAAGQFAYLTMGETLDRAVLTGTVPSTARILASARDGVRTFLARYGTRKPRRRRPLKKGSR